MNGPLDIEQARLLRDWNGFIESRVHKALARRGSQADLDDLRQEARVAAWRGYLEWKAMPDEERDPNMLAVVVSRKIKDAVLDGSARLRQVPRDSHQRGGGAAAKIFHDLLASTPSERGVGARYGRFSQTFTAYQLLLTGALHGSAGLIDPETARIRREALDRVVYALARLDDDDRRILEGLFYEGRTLADVCAELGIHGRSTQSRRRRRALDEARKYMEEYASALGTHNTGGTLDDEPGGSFA